VALSQPVAYGESAAQFADFEDALKKVRGLGAPQQRRACAAG
jgi:hypothetical protein